MTVKITINHNPNGHESYDYLADEFQEAVDQYNRAVEIGDFKGQTIYFSRASTLEDIIVNLFDATVDSWYE